MCGLELVLGQTRGGSGAFRHLLEGGLELVEALAVGRGQLGLNASLKAGLGLGHELLAHVVPRRVVRRRDRDGGVREIADWKRVGASVRSTSLTLCGGGG